MKKTALAALLLGTAATAAHADGVEADYRGLTLEAGPVELNLGGRIHVDGAVFNDPVTGQTGVTEVDFRRARLELSGKIGEVVRFRVDREFAGGSKGWRNLWLGFEPTENLVFRGGNMMAPFSWEDLQSSNSIPFAERSLASNLAPGYGLGGSASASGKRWSASLGWFDDALDAEDGRTVERGRGVVGRVTALPLSRDGTRVHVGIGGEHRSFRPGEVLRLSADPGSTLAPNIMTTGALNDIENLNGWSGELGFTHGPLLVQAQAMGLGMSRTALPDLHFNGQTVQAAWLLTGGKYGYARGSGNFSGPELKGGKFAVELAARYSRMDLSDATLDRGVGRALTGGANLYFGRNFRIMADYTHTRVRFAAPTPDETNQVGVLRLQVNY